MQGAGVVWRHHPFHFSPNTMQTYALDMVSLVCQLSWAMGHLDIYSSVILGVSVREALDEINILICGL